jgi:chitinase
MVTITITETPPPPECAAIKRTLARSLQNWYGSAFAGSTKLRDDVQLSETISTGLRFIVEADGSVDARARQLAPFDNGQTNFAWVTGTPANLPAETNLRTALAVGLVNPGFDAVISRGTIDYTLETVSSQEPCPEDPSRSRTVETDLVARVSFFELNVREGNRAPVCADRSGSVQAGSSVDVAPSCSDADNDTLSFAIGSPGSKGVASVVNGVLRYAANVGASGTDVFTYTANDGNGGVSAPATVTLTITAPPANAVPVCVDRMGSVEAGSSVDVAPSCSDGDNDTLSFAIGSPGSKGVASVVNGVLRYAANVGASGTDVFTYTASDGRGGVSAPATVTITITGVPPVPLPTISVASVSVCEGTSKYPTKMRFTVTLSAPAPAGGVTVSYTTADGTAAADSDYTAASGTLTFAPGQRTKTVDVLIVADSVDELDETLSLRLSAPSGATLGADVATGTIVDDDVPPPVATVSITKTICAEEPKPGYTTKVELTVSLSYAAPAGGVTVDYMTRDGTAKAGTDYQAAAGTVVFAPGERTKKIVVHVAADSTHESDETFYVDLVGVTGHATLSDRRTARIDIALNCKC